MRRVLKWLGLGLTGIVGLAAIGVAYVYGASEYAIKRHYDFPLTSFAAPNDATAIERGKRVAILSGCYAGCHGKTMEGVPGFFNEAGVARINAPNLTHVLHEYSDPELERLLRHGVKRDGTTAWVMPAPMFSHLSEQDLGDLIAFLRTVPEQDGAPREFSAMFVGRLGMMLGKFQPIVEQVDHTLPRVAVADRSDPLKHGEYLVKTACIECHGQSLEGSEFVHSPNLAIVQAYSEEDFFRLMRTGRALGDRKLELMAEAATVRFTLYTDDEIRAVRMYLLKHAQGEATATVATR